MDKAIEKAIKVYNNEVESLVNKMQSIGKEINSIRQNTKDNDATIASLREINNNNLLKVDILTKQFNDLKEESDLKRGKIEALEEFFA